MKTSEAQSPAPYREARGSGKKAAKKEIEGLRIKFGANGGHVVTHDYKRPEQKGDRYIPAPESDDFPFGPDEGHKALSHVAKHMKMKAKVSAAGGEQEPDGDE